ncbi:MAG: C4-type zinc ribbon domain-containing protein [Desulfobacterales bacterium]|nr:C4-type zinc ribbon domain-containing protein [Desulfobacterales bacterium]
MASISREKIQSLVDLQTVEADIRRVGTLLAETPAKLAAVTLELEAFEATLAEEDGQLQAVQKTYREQEREAQVALAQIRKSNERLATVKTNKEYQLILKEIDDLKRKNSLIEDEMLACLDRIEAADAAVKQKKAQVLALRQTADLQKAEIERETRQLTAHLTDLTQAGREAARAVDPVLLESFRRVQEQVKQGAVAPVVDAVCQGCHLNIPWQLFNELHRFDELTFCPHCRRIIFCREEEKA